MSDDKRLTRKQIEGYLADIDTYIEDQSDNKRDGWLPARYALQQLCEMALDAERLQRKLAEAEKLYTSTSHDCNVTADERNALRGQLAAERARRDAAERELHSLTMGQSSEWQQRAESAESQLKAANERVAELERVLFDAKSLIAELPEGTYGYSYIGDPEVVGGIRMYAIKDEHIADIDAALAGKEKDDG